MGSPRRCADALKKAGFGPGAVTRGWFPVALGVPRGHADLPDAPGRGDLRRLESRRPASKPRRAGRARRALAEPAGHRGSITIIILVGTPAAYLLATRSFRGKALAVTLVELPLVLPPAVAGIALLAALGPSGILGGTIEAAGIELSFTTAGVVVALTFVASPFYVRQAMAAFAAVDRTLLDASRTLGASEARGFLRVMIPVAVPGLTAGTALASAAHWGSSARR